MEQFTITIQDYPELFKYNDDNRINKIKQIFNTGYNIHFPNIEQIEDNDNLNLILNRLQNLDQLDEVSSSLNKLIGIGNNSSKKGEFAEQLLEDLINDRYGDLVFENKAQVDHSGDAWITLPDDNIVMLESKNYTTKVLIKELNKMEYDMKYNNIQFGIFISWNSSLQNFRDFDIHTFMNNGRYYYIIIICNLTNNIEKLDLSIQLIRKMISIFNQNNNFMLIKNYIEDDINKLNEIIYKIIEIRKHFELIENNIKQLLNEHYTLIRNYEYDLNSSINQLINSITETVNSSITYSKLNLVDNMDFIETYKNNKFIFNNLLKLMELVINYKYKYELDDNIIGLYKKEEYIGEIKIMKKKIVLRIIKKNCSVDIEKEFDDYQFIKFLFN